MHPAALSLVTLRNDLRRVLAPMWSREAEPKQSPVKRDNVQDENRQQTKSQYS
jgi:hypothetical protein